MTTTTREAFLPIRDRSEPFSLALASDDIAAATDDETERQVLRNVAAEIATTLPATTIGEAIDALDRLGPIGRGQLLDRAREKAGVRSLAQQAIDNVNIYPDRGRRTYGPARNPDGSIDKLCGEPGCMNFEPGTMVGAFARTKAVRWYCPEHANSDERIAEMNTEWTGPRLGYGPSGNVVDLDEQEAEKQKAALREQHRQAEIDERNAAAERDARALAEHREAARQRDLAETRHQFPWQS